MEFQLILHEINSDAAARPQEIARILGAECGLNFVEIDASLGDGPLSIASGLSSERANRIKNQLEAVGAKVLLIRSVQKPDQSPREGKQQNQQVLFHNVFEGYKKRLFHSLQSLDGSQVAELGIALLKARQDGRQIYILGNGGSAANASHLANDIQKHGHNDHRFSFRVMSLTDNTPLITAISNDFGYQHIFSEQLRTLLSPGDVVIAISSSGNSQNVLDAISYAKGRGAITFCLVGFDGGKLSSLADHIVMVPSAKGDYGVMEDGCLIIGHMLSEFFTEHDKPTIK